MAAISLVLLGLVVGAGVLLPTAAVLHASGATHSAPSGCTSLGSVHTTGTDDQNETDSGDSGTNDTGEDGSGVTGGDCGDSPDANPG